MKWARVFEKIMPMMTYNLPLAIYTALVSFVTKVDIPQKKLLILRQGDISLEDNCNTARRLQFEEENESISPIESIQRQIFAFKGKEIVSSGVNAKKRNRTRAFVPDETSAVRRSTRNSVKTNGFKLEPMRDKPTPKRKKPRKAKPTQEESSVTPHTPVRILQQVGRTLEIPETELTEDRLMANPKQDKPKDINDD